MARYLIKESILVVRDGKRVSPEIGKSFDLTNVEIDQLKAIRPQAIEKLGKVEADPRSIDTGDDDLDDDDDLGGNADTTAAETAPKTSAPRKKVSAKRGSAEDL